MKNLFLNLLVLTMAGTLALASPEELIKQAQQFERDGQLPKAIEAYESFLKQFSDHSQVVEVHFRLAKAYDLTGKMDEMEKNLKAVCDSDKKQFRNRAEAFVLLAKHHASSKKYEEAAALLEKLLGEGSAGLYEEEALNLCAGYYAVLKKYDDAGAKLNLLRLRRDSPYAESASAKLVVLWLNAGKLDLAINAISEFARAYPNNAQIPELLLRAADAFRELKKYDQAVALCEQIQSRYPKSPESLSSLVLVGLCHRDRGSFKEAAEIFDKVSKNRELQTRGIAAEAMAQSAEIYFTELKDPDAAMLRYEEAAKYARDSEGENKSKILELCYFRLGEHHFAKKNWAAARENYLLLRSLGSQLNVTPRIMQCEQELKMAAGTPQTYGESDIKAMREEIEKNPGTFRSAELEIFLLDQKVNDGLKRQASIVTVGPEYEKLLTTYSRDVLAQDNLEAHIWWQIGLCRESSQDVATLKKSVEAYEKVIRLDPNNALGYKLNALERLALTAERAGNKPRAVQAYKELFEITRKQLDPKAEKPDAAQERKAMDYLKSLITRADSGNMMDDAIAITKRTIEERGPASDLARESRLYLGELYMLKRDFSSAAKAFQEFLDVYGPKRDEEGNYLNGPLKASYPPDEKTAQLFDAAIRMAHCWYIERHEQNLVRTYQWIATNLPNGNKYMAEVRYALAMELAKGKDAQSKEAKRKFAETMWRTVVNPSTDFEARDFDKTMHFWVRPNDAAFTDLQPYVKNAMLRVGQAYGEAGEHELAAGAFEKFLQLYGQDKNRKVGAVKRQERNVRVTAVDSEEEMARYALGRELIALNRIPRLIQVFKPYLSGARDSKYRISALMLLGFHAGRSGQKDAAIEAYATILDEYGVNNTNAKGEMIPVPSSERIRQGNYNWDGYRLEPPAKLDLGEVRYALGFLYWNNNDWGQCAKTLAPFMTDESLAKNKSADRALYMLGQSHYRNYDYVNGYKVLIKLIDGHPRFEALEEVYVNAARGAVEAKAWNDVDRLCREFALKWPKSDRRQRMDLYNALRVMFGKGTVDVAVSSLKGLAQGETYEDVKADAWYWLGRNELAFNPPRYADALNYFDKSVTVFAREPACLDAAKCAAKLRQWDKAKLYLDRVISEFAKGNPVIVQEARLLMPEVMKEIAKQK
jgi:tetratricopeptide (TPR) repeat protein